MTPPGKSVCLYNASWSTFGGGEKYVCAFADALAKTGEYRVTLLVDTASATLEGFHRYFNLDLSGAVIEEVRRNDVAARLAAADIGVVLSNFRPFGNRARKNVCLLQLPYGPITIPRLLLLTARGRFREAAKDLFRRRLLKDAHEADLVILNSRFVADVLRASHGIEAKVLYPPIDDFMTDRPKEHIILSVGRIFRGLYNDKRYDILIEGFRRLREKLRHSSWQYRIIGSCANDTTSQRYLASLRAAATGLPVYFHINTPYEELRRQYNEAAIFWHAAGFGADEARHPERVEHFGMSTVEAMSAGCVPVVIDRGGQREIVSHGESGYLWNTLDELIGHTIALMEEPALLARMKEGARARSCEFTGARFARECVSLIHTLDSNRHG